MSSFNVAAVHRARIAELGMDGIGSPRMGVGNPDAVSFGEGLKRAIGEVSAVQENAQSSIQAFLRGEPIELHQVMAATEEAGIAVEMLVEVRNKFVEAYRTLVSMQS